MSDARTRFPCCEMLRKSEAWRIRFSGGYRNLIYAPAYLLGSLTVRRFRPFFRR